jgi:hypothetical protein
LVEKEIAAVVLKNKERKKRKGKDGALAVHTGFTNEVDEHLLFLEDVVEKWKEKMEVRASMVSKLYEAQFGKTVCALPATVANDAQVSQKVQSKVYTCPE